MGKKDPRIDTYIADAQPFARPILKYIRKAMHAGCPGVQETMKWSMPHFDHHGILAGMSAFKEHAALGFWKGSLLGLPEPSEKAMGQFGRIRSIDDLPSERALTALVKRAATLNEEGAAVKRIPKAPRAKVIDLPDYFAAALNRNKKAKAAFDAFSPSHRREYVEWITSAKQQATRERRMATALEWLAEGKSMNWRYER